MVLDRNHNHLYSKFFWGHEEVVIVGVAKRHAEAEEDRFNTATGIAIEAGTLERCEYCECTVFQDSGDLDAAIDLGVEQFEAGEHRGTFKSKKDLIECITKAVESGDHSAECCFDCDERMNGDD
jgi:hypothetical protein